MDQKEIYKGGFMRFLRRSWLFLPLLALLGGCFTSFESLLIGSMAGMFGQSYAKPWLDKVTPADPSAPPTKEEIKKLIQEALSQMQQGNPPAPKPPN